MHRVLPNGRSCETPASDPGQAIGAFVGTRAVGCRASHPNSVRAGLPAGKRRRPRGGPAEQPSRGTNCTKAPGRLVETLGRGRGRSDAGRGLLVRPWRCGHPGRSRSCDASSASMRAYAVAAASVTPQPMSSAPCAKPTWRSAADASWPSLANAQAHQSRSTGPLQTAP
jgi:hypothetical protein